MYVPQRAYNYPIALMRDSPRFARCLQGGGVYFQSGTVTITSSSIYGNTGRVRAHVQNYPSPCWGIHTFCAMCLQGGGGVAIRLYPGGIVSIVNCRVYSNQAIVNTPEPYVRASHAYESSRCALFHMFRACACRVAVSMFWEARSRLGLP